MSRARLLLLVVAIAALSAPASAHDFDPGVLALDEVAPGRFEVAWTEPVDSTGAPGGVSVIYPSHCRSEARLVDCGAAGLGELRFEGLRGSRMQIVVHIARRDGSTHEALVTGADPRLELRARRGRLLWLGLGIEHILLGLDHVAFVLGLLLLVESRKRLPATITAFTLAHSLTLALATLDILRLPSAPVEATIAASIVLVAREALDETPTATRRAPWAVALLFGLVHGLGFAGALREVGLPSSGLGWALFGFNLGVELGQIAVVAAALGLAALVRRWLSDQRWPKHVASYALGSLGAWWLLERAVAIFTAPP